MRASFSGRMAALEDEDVDANHNNNTTTTTTNTTAKKNKKDAEKKKGPTPAPKHTRKYGTPMTGYQLEHGAKLMAEDSPFASLNLKEGDEKRRGERREMSTAREPVVAEI